MYTFLKIYKYLNIYISVSNNNLVKKKTNKKKPQNKQTKTAIVTKYVRPLSSPPPPDFLYDCQYFQPWFNITFRSLW